MRYDVPDFSTQVVIFLKGEEVGQLSVLAETINSNDLASVARRLVPLHSLSRQKFRIFPTTSEPNYLFVLATLLESWRTSSVLRA